MKFKSTTYIPILTSFILLNCSPKINFTLYEETDNNDQQQLYLLDNNKYFYYSTGTKYSMGPYSVGKYKLTTDSNIILTSRDQLTLDTVIESKENCPVKLELVDKYNNKFLNEFIRIILNKKDTFKLLEFQMNYENKFIKNYKIKSFDLFFPFISDKYLSYTVRDTSTSCLVAKIHSARGGIETHNNIVFFDNYILTKNKKVLISKKKILAADSVYYPTAISLVPNDKKRLKYLTGTLLRKEDKKYLLNQQEKLWRLKNIIPSKQLA